LESWRKVELGNNSGKVTKLSRIIYCELYCIGAFYGKIVSAEEQMECRYESCKSLRETLP